MHVASIAGATAIRSAGNVSDFFSALDAFRKIADETPAERARDQVLEKHGVGEAGYEKLPPMKREAIDREVVEAVRRALAADAESRKPRRSLTAQLFD
ncbi:hypothetical protein IAG41_05010 [Sphingomonas sp. JC676]|uniref:hypothetical protein n=1 Tax=Sphingomonas sp. JC676 TaxID=2768065 RepID=UPI001657ECB0|nr:hypothetical protein [Sphingomonas sp. JC676]MBC9031745.1 hypothetical protein [Sphingomonas sp. JC676]